MRITTSSIDIATRSYFLRESRGDTCRPNVIRNLRLEITTSMVSTTRAGPKSINRTVVVICSASLSKGKGNSSGINIADIDNLANVHLDIVGGLLLGKFA